MFKKCINNYLLSINNLNRNNLNNFRYKNALFATSTIASEKKTNEILSEKPKYVVDLDDEDLEEKLETPSFLIEEEDVEAKEKEIEKKRNKSRLLPQHRRMLNNQLPYDEPQSWIHTTAKYKRMMFGRYGLESGTDPRICFYSKKEQFERDEYERVAHPKTLLEMIEINRKANAEKQAKIQERENDIARKIDKLAQWESDLKTRIMKKEQDARAVKERKERLVEEVRRQFGFKLDTRDERFKELLAQKEKEDKKKQKEARRQMREEKMLAILQEKTKEFQENKPIIPGSSAPNSES